MDPFAFEVANPPERLSNGRRKSPKHGRRPDQYDLEERVAYTKQLLGRMDKAHAIATLRETYKISDATIYSYIHRAERELAAQYLVPDLKPTVRVLAVKFHTAILMSPRSSYKEKAESLKELCKLSDAYPSIKTENKHQVQLLDAYSDDQLKDLARKLGIPLPHPTELTPPDTGTPQQEVTHVPDHREERPELHPTDGSGEEIPDTLPGIQDEVLPDLQAPGQFQTQSPEPDLPQPGDDPLGYPPGEDPRSRESCGT